MRVVLVRPNSYILPTAPPMGPVSLAAWLERERGDSVHIIDARKKRIPPQNLASQVEALRPDVVGISSLSVEAPDTHAVAAAIRTRMPDVPIVVGGPYASASPYAVMSDPNVDHAVVGEGEQSFSELLDAIEAGGPAGPVAGVWSRFDGAPAFGGARGGVAVDDLPEPAWNKLPMESYFKPGRNTHDTVPPSYRCLQVMTSRGCPFRCVYCHGLFGREFRPRGAGKVLDEISSLVKTYRLEAIEICDDIFNLDMDRAKEILGGIEPLKIAISFPNGIRGDRVDDEMLDLMKKAGVRRVTFAVESASKRIQKVIRKGLDVEKVRENIAKAAGRGFLTAGFFMLGFPDETAEDMEKTIEFAVRSQLHIASFFYLTAFPGTEVARLIEEKGIVVDNAPRDYSTLYVNLTAEPDNVVKAMRKRAYRRFYGDPGRILRTLKAAPKNRQTFMSAWKVLLLSLRDSVDY